MASLLWYGILILLFHAGRIHCRYGRTKPDPDQAGRNRDRLAVTFGKFEPLPLTTTQAKKEGWKIDASCQGPTRNFFKGYRYAKDNDTNTRLLFDCHGHVAGIQTTIKPVAGFPTKFNSAPWFNNNDGTISATAYFRDPKKICSCKKSCSHGNEKPVKPVGDRLWIQLGNERRGKINAMALPLSTKDMVNTPWVEGNCVTAMGMHYHYNISKDFDCNYALPVFLIGNKQTNEVHGFGWAVPFRVEDKMERWEYPPPELFARSIKEADMPACIQNYKAVSVQHIYFVDPFNIYCF